jgi:2-methylisocitrate lyase-like PEP mutase family enzyme
MSSQVERARRFRLLHGERPLVLPNAWDGGSARVFEAAGAQAIATTSAGVSWAHGRRDGQTLSREEMIRAIRYIVEAVSLPVTADVEGGYGTGSPGDVAETVRAVIEAGAVGLNLEDSPGGSSGLLMAPEKQAERLRAAREAARTFGVDIVINARTDVYLLQVGAPETRFDLAVARARSYRAAGADCVFVPGVIDVPTIAALVRAVGGPLNVMAMPGAPRTSELGELGVARVSVGPSIAQAALATTREATLELVERGTYGRSEDRLSIADLNSILAGGTGEASGVRA